MRLPARSSDRRGSCWQPAPWFRSTSPALFAKHFLNFADLEGYGGAFVRGARNTLTLALAGELGGILIGLILGVLTLSRRRSVRAPARI